MRTCSWLLHKVLCIVFHVRVVFGLVTFLEKTSWFLIFSLESWKTFTILVYTRSINVRKAILHFFFTWTQLRKALIIGTDSGKTHQILFSKTGHFDIFVDVIADALIKILVKVHGGVHIDLQIIDFLLWLLNVWLLV
jgi:hypothetical protein